MILDERPGLSQAISVAAGSKLQEEIFEKFPMGVQLEEVAVTGGHGLDCKAIFHGQLNSFFAKQENGLLPEQILYSFVFKCLEETSKNNFQSIAFPALGSGLLQFPPSIAASYVIDAILDFRKNTPTTSLKFIRIVVFGGTTDWSTVEKAYITKLISAVQKDAVAVPAPTPTLPLRGSREFLAFKYKEDTRTPSYWTYFDSSKTIKEWNTTQKEEHCKVINLEKNSEVYQSIANTFSKTNGGSKIVSIQRIENILLFEQYIHECQRMFRKAFATHLCVALERMDHSSGPVKTVNLLGDDIMSHLYEEINEFYLFHGTKHDLVDVIIHQGLDSRLSSTGRLGTGVYTAEMADKSTQYTDQNEKNEQKMFLMRVCLGDIYITDEENYYIRPPCKECYTDRCTTHPDLYDSIVAEFERREFVVYDRCKCYPEYLITFK